MSQGNNCREGSLSSQGTRANLFGMVDHGTSDHPAELLPKIASMRLRLAMFYCLMDREHVFLVRRLSQQHGIIKQTGCLTLKRSH